MSDINLEITPNVSTTVITVDQNTIEITPSAIDLTFSTGGIIGATGATGPIGASGATGPAGGPTGATGATGATGIANPGGSNGDVQYYSNGAFGATGALNYISANGLLRSTGNVEANYFVGRLGNNYSNVNWNVGSGVVSISAQGVANVVTVIAGTANVNGNLNVTGNITGPYVGNSGGIANGTSSITIPVANGNIVVSAGGAPNEIVITPTSVNVSTQINAAGQTAIVNFVQSNLIQNSGNITAANVFANTGNINANRLIGNLITGVLTTASQPNITAIGNLSSVNTINMTAIANIQAGNLVVGTLPSQGNIFAYNNIGAQYWVTAGYLQGTISNASSSQPNITTLGNLTGVSLAPNADITMSGIGATISGANLISGNIIAGTLSTPAQPNITSVGTLTGLNVNGSINGGNLTSVNANLGNAARANYFIGDGTFISNISVGSNVNYIQNGNSNVFVYPNGFVVTTVANSSIIEARGGVDGVLINSNLRVFGNLFMNYANNQDLYVGGNVVVGNGSVTLSNANSSFNGNLLGIADKAYNVLGNIQPNITSLGTLIGLNVNGTATFTSTMNGNLTGSANTVRDNAQPNITSVGNLTSLNVIGTANAGNFTTLGQMSASLVTATNGNISGNLNIGNSKTTFTANINVAAMNNTARYTPAANVSQIQRINVTPSGANANIFIDVGLLREANVFKQYNWLIYNNTGLTLSASLANTGAPSNNDASFGMVLANNRFGQMTINVWGNGIVMNNIPWANV